MKMKRAKDLEAGDVMIGDHGGLSRITGYVEPSNAMMGCVSIETEHGTLYMDPEDEVAVDVP